MQNWYKSADRKTQNKCQTTPCHVAAITILAHLGYIIKQQRTIEEYSIFSSFW